MYKFVNFDIHSKVKGMTSSIKPELEDVLMTAVHLAATELAKIYPQAEEVELSVKIWQQYLIQQALKTQDRMAPWEREMYRRTHLLID